MFYRASIARALTCDGVHRYAATHSDLGRPYVGVCQHVPMMGHSAFGTLRPRVQIPPSRPDKSWSWPTLLSTGLRRSSADHAQTTSIAVSNGLRDRKSV